MKYISHLNFDLSKIKNANEKDYKQIKTKIAKKLLNHSFIGTTKFDKFYYNLNGSFGYKE